MKANHEISDKEWELIAKAIYDENVNPEREGTDLGEPLFSDEKEREQVLKAAQKVDLVFSLKKYNPEQAWQKVSSRIHGQTNVSRGLFRELIHHPGFRVAASLLFAALLLISGYELFFKAGKNGSIIEVSAVEQVINTIKLPDGTLVSLNSNTKLKYPKKFGATTREVQIEGEAFFEVMPNKNKPFIIQAGNAQIKVLGTSFNVNAYPESKQVEVTVETGKVQFLNKTARTAQSNELILTPGDKGTLVYSSNSLLKTSNLNPNFMAWKTHNLIFKATSLGEVIDVLEEVYKVHISLADQRLKGLLLTAQFNNYSLDFILEVIENTFQIEAKNVEGQYILTAKSNT